MSLTITAVDGIDLDISVVSIEFGLARAAFERCPSAENERRVVQATAAVDRLLDARLAAAPQS